MKHLIPEGAYDRRQLLGKAAYRDFVMEIVRRIATEPGFKVLPRLWVVERTSPGCAATAVSFAIMKNDRTSRRP